MAKKITSNKGTLYAAEKGESGNPNGRPKGAMSSKTILNNILDGVLTYEDAGKLIKITRREKMLLNIVNDAISDDEDPATRLRAAQFILDRVEGKAVETSNVNATVQSFTTPGAVSVDELEQILRIVKIEPKSEE